jgi:hypothetical protein
VTDTNQTPADKTKSGGPSRREFITRTAAIAGTAALL